MEVQPVFTVVILNGDGLGSDSYDLADVAQIITVVFGLVANAEGLVKVNWLASRVHRTVNPNTFSGGDVSVVDVDFFWVVRCTELREAFGLNVLDGFHFRCSCDLLFNFLYSVYHKLSHLSQRCANELPMAIKC